MLPICRDVNATSDATPKGGVYADENLYTRQEVPTPPPSFPPLDTFNQPLPPADGFEHRLVDVKRPLLHIPTLAIHLERSVNDAFKVGPQ